MPQEQDFTAAPLAHSHATHLPTRLQECMCFKSAMLPLRLSFTISSQPVRWQPGENAGQSLESFPTLPMPGHVHHHGSAHGAGHADAIDQAAMSGVDAAGGCVQ